uniref:Uncharacterized protein n=1 Tax=Nelumbo nucifera TaxID=4432 RepID=A0A822ZMH2_NELNU|nr:TPA_asm: hypothetical protein HUJ06_002386 [Nelumbo nucifera]
MMINFRGGFKCNSCLLEVVRDLEGDNMWKDFIANYPPKTLVSPFMRRRRRLKKWWIATSKISEFATKFFMYFFEFAIKLL